MEEGLEQALKSKLFELQGKLEELKRYDIDQNVEKLLISLPKRKRCTICTLKLPCKHFSSVTEMIESTPKITQNFLEKRKHIKTSSQDQSDLKADKKIEFSVNYRGKEWRFLVDPKKNNNFLHDQRRHSVLSSIEKYREMKLLSEIDNATMTFNEEKERKKEKCILEDKKRRYYSKQKEKIKKYRQELSENIKVYYDKERKNRLIEKAKEKTYYENKKRILLSKIKLE